MIAKKDPLLAEIFVEFYEMLQDYLASNPLSAFRTIEWRDTLELDTLFTSESLSVTHGQYLDQRFVDFLERNTNALDFMNWRKFEGLAAEYFAREGYAVEIGSGRADDGVDIRIWEQGTLSSSPPTILVQCKRTRRKVDKLVVKALWADVQDAQAGSGMIVTTTCLSPGARKVCHARAYSIHEADRSTIKAWLNAMRTPYSGVFMAI